MFSYFGFNYVGIFITYCGNCLIFIEISSCILTILHCLCRMLMIPLKNNVLKHVITAEFWFCRGIMTHRQLIAEENTNRRQLTTEEMRADDS